MVNLVVSDKNFRQRVIEKQRERLNLFNRRAAEEKLASFLDQYA